MLSCKKNRARRFACMLLSVMLLACTFASPVWANETASIYPPQYAVEDYWYDDSLPAAVFGGDFDVGSMLLMEYSTGKVLYAMNENDKVPIASVTKVMSALLILEALDSGRISLNDTVTVSETAASMGGSQVYLEPFEQMSVEDLLKSMVVSSANDATVALAEHISGSVESFVTQMNERAAQLGMANTHFVNTTGLDAEGHYSSAYDVALMTRELMHHSLIFNYSTIWMDTIRNGAFGLANTNKLIRFYPGATGMKTGYTSSAGFCVSATAQRDGMQVIAVVLDGSTSDERFSAAKKMMDFAFANYSIIKPERCELEPLSVKRGTSENVALTYEPPSILTEKGSPEVSAKFELVESVEAPVTKGTQVGIARYSINGQEVATAPVTVADDCERMDFITMLWRILCSFPF